MADISTKDRSDFKRYYGPWAIVAGASEGLGAAYAEQLAARGLNLVLVARRDALLRAFSLRLTKEYQVQVKALSLDLSRPEAAEKVNHATADLEIGMLIYNAAFSAVGPFLDHSMDDHLREIDTNIRTPLALTYLFGQRMLENGRGGNEFDYISCVQILTK